MEKRNSIIGVCPDFNGGNQCSDAKSDYLVRCFAFPGICTFNCMAVKADYTKNTSRNWNDCFLYCFSFPEKHTTGSDRNKWYLGISVARCFIPIFLFVWTGISECAICFFGLFSDSSVDFSVSYRLLWRCIL